MEDNDQLSSLSDDLFLELLVDGTKTLSSMITNQDDPRYAIKSFSTKSFAPLIEKYGTIPQKGGDAKQISKEIIKDLYVGVPRWTSPRFEYNVGTSVNQAAAAAYALALQQNVYNINDGLAGNTLIAEEAVTRILAHLAKVNGEAHGIFTFGGTATNLYGMKIGIKKANPHSSKSGVGTNTRIFITEDAHFSHVTCAEWLGIGSDNVIIIGANKDGTSNLEELKQKLTESLDQGFLIGGIFINGGTTYDHCIDDIEGSVKIRDQLIIDYGLTYKPHLHVDSVIGWIWLFFADYNWENNPLHISSVALKRIREQYNRIKHINLADSWGVDFHKSIGGCPIDCSTVIINRREDAMLLSRKSSEIAIHQLAAEYSLKSPVEYTLETSRASGAPLAALTALQTSGIEGYQKKLANLIEQALFMRQELSRCHNIEVCKIDSLGFVTILRILPPDLESSSYSNELIDSTQSGLDRSNRISEYTKSFFDWDYHHRIKTGGTGPEFSFSSKYTTLPNGAEVGAIKVYPVSPLFDKKYAIQTIETIKKSVNEFEKLRQP